jgi:hypothetical protein
LALQPASNIEDTDHQGTDWIISVDTVIAGIHTNLGLFKINPGVTVTVQPSTVTAAPWDGARFGKVEIYASTISVYGVLSATGSGFAGGYPKNTGFTVAGVGPGGGGGGASGGNGTGGGYGGKGGDAIGYDGVGGSTYGVIGIYTFPVSINIELGSGGGSGSNGGYGGFGGGSIVLSASSICVNSLLADGVIGQAQSNTNPWAAGGGGSGGGILVDSTYLTVYGTISSNGGSGGITQCCGIAYSGGGGGGRIKIFYNTKNIFSPTVDGGLGNKDGSTTQLSSGAEGTIYYDQKPSIPNLTSPSIFISQNDLPTFSWTSVTDPAGDPVTYHLQVSSHSNFNPIFIETSPSTTIFYSTQPLTRNTTYYARVRAFDQISYTGFSSLVSFVYVDTTPPTGQGIVAVTAQISSVSVVLANATDAVSGLNPQPYDVDVSSSPQFVWITTSSLYQSQTTWYAMGLEANTTYYFRTKARDAAGNETPWTSTTSMVTLTKSPEGITVSTFSASSMTVSWTESSPRNPANTDYILQVSSTALFPWVSPVPGEGTQASSQTIQAANSAVVSGLTPNTSYQIRVLARNWQGISSTSTVLSTVTFCNPPAQTTAAFVSPWSIVVGWQGNGNPGYTTYQVDFSSYSDFSFRVSSDTKTTSAHFGSLVPSTQYFYRVTAVNLSGSSVTTAVLSTRTFASYSISGTVTDPASTALPSILMTLTGSANGSVLSSVAGYWQFTNLVATGVYTITPSSYSYFSFSPVNMNISNVQTDLAGQNFMRVSTMPVLSYSGEIGYTNSTVFPTAGTYGSHFVFRVNYVDPNNDPPKSGYPKLNLYLSTGSGGSGGTPLVGSPFVMLETDVTDTNYLDGKIYAFSTDQIITTSRYSHQIEAYNVYGVAASSLTTVGYPVVGFDPMLSYTGESNYTNSGLFPLTGMSTTTFTFRIKYTDADNDAPKTGYPKMHLYKSGQEIPGSPFSMTAADTSDQVYSDGKIYFYPTTLSTGLYTYSFETQDYWGGLSNTPSGSGPNITLTISGYVLDPSSNPLSGVPMVLGGDSTGTIATDGSGFYQFTGLGAGSSYRVFPATSSYLQFDVSTRTYSNVQVSEQNQNFVRVDSAPVICWTNETNYTNDGLYPKIGTSTTTFTFRIRYQDADGDAPKTGYPRVCVKRGGLAVSSSPFALSYVSGDVRTGAVYSASVHFNILSSSYTYDFQAYDVFNATAVWRCANPQTQVSSITAPFTVFANAPTGIQNAASKNIGKGTIDGATVVSSRVELMWEGSDPYGNPLMFDLYLSQPITGSQSFARSLFATGAATLSRIWSGEEKSYTLTNLLPGKTYVWRVDGTNMQGVTTQGPAYTFTTLDIPVNKPFNYPNPFNPHQQNTNIVYKLSNDQPVDIRVYSEFGDLIFKDTSHGAAGTNIYVWNGRDNHGRVLWNGSYICMVRSAEGAYQFPVLVIK